MQEKDFVAYLHIHSCLSACAELEMTPRRIVGRAAEEGIDIIALSDHNSARNAEVAIGLGREAGVLVLPALEVCSTEEAHVLAIFGTLEDALRMQEAVYQGLGPLVDDRWQVVVDADEGVTEFEGMALMGASNMSLDELPGIIRSFGGLAVASHIDREAFSVTSQLGFIPDGVIFDAIEVMDPERAEMLLVGKGGAPWIASSDAHHLQDLGRRATVLKMQEASFEEISLAFKGEGGRTVRPRFS